MIWRGCYGNYRGLF